MKLRALFASSIAERFFALGTAAGLCLAVSACTTKSSDGRSTQVGAQPISFALQSLTGKPDRIENHGGRVEVINLWATWCPPCKDELPLLDRTARSAAANVVGIDQGDDASKVRELVRRYKLSYPILLDPDQQFGANYATVGLPTTIILNPRGRISVVHAGVYEATELKHDLQLAAKS